MLRRGPLCHDMVLKLKALLGRDRSFSNRDRVVFLLFFYHDVGLLSVATETAEARG